MICPHCNEDIDRIVRTQHDCPCWECNPHAWWMVVCPRCRDKRCPHATDHANACAG